MTTALFIFRKRITDKDNNVSYNDNFINLLNVQSAYWTVGENGEKTLSVFLPTYTFTFPQTTGERFLAHFEEFLRYLIASPVAEIQHSGAASAQHNNQNRKPRNPIATEEVIEEENTPAAVWES